LDTNNLKGGFPSGLHNFAELKSLYLADNALSGTLPGPELAQMTKLATLELYRNKFSGAIPSDIAKLTALTCLALEMNKFTGQLPGLPFAQYIECCLEEQELDLKTNHFACPLPPVRARRCGAIVCHAP
jgi:hypothetical protein